MNMSAGQPVGFMGIPVGRSVGRSMRKQVIIPTNLPTEDPQVTTLVFSLSANHCRCPIAEKLLQRKLHLHLKKQTTPEYK